MTVSAPTMYDLLVIGGGSAGLTAAKTAARMKYSVCLVEKGRFGGDCTWSGCVPSKSLLASAERAHDVRTADAYGVASAAGKVDMAAVRRRLGGIIDHIYNEDDSPEALNALGIDTIHGSAKFVAPKVLEVVETDDAGVTTSTRRVAAARGIVVATGARPRKPRIDGIDDVAYLTYESVFTLEALPARLTVVGGGPIGCELGQAFARLGSTVTLIAKALVPGSEPEASEALRAALVADGVTIIGAHAASVTREGADPGAHQLTCSDGTVVHGDVLLTAVGREAVRTHRAHMQQQCPYHSHPSIILCTFFSPCRVCFTCVCVWCR